jgi:hypothetical protein
MAQAKDSEDHLVVVSGLPRSGTSLMMAALAAGGLPILTDQERPADAHNPRGYFEDSRVLTLPQHPEWLHGQEGRGVKILSHLLHRIPSTVKARVLFMRRPLRQVLASQSQMLGHADTPEEVASLIARDLAQTLLWLEGQSHLSVLEVSYTAVLQDPVGQFARIIEFLGLPLDAAAMAATVDPALHRQKG